MKSRKADKEQGAIPLEREERKKGRETTGESLELDQGLPSPSMQSPEEATASADRNVTQDGK